jgi:pentatricopeptide repeat protein
MENKGLRPDVITYNTLLAGNARNRQKKEAYELLSEMVQMGRELHGYIIKNQFEDFLGECFDWYVCQVW